MADCIMDPKRFSLLLLLIFVCCNPYSLPEKRTAASETALAFYQESLAAYSDGLFDQAHERINAAIELNPNFAQFYQLKGDILRALKEYNAAIESYNMAITLRSNLPEVYQSIGEIHYIELRFDEAVKAFKKILATDENRIDVYLEIASCYIAMREYQLALNNVKDYVRLAESINVPPDQRHLLLRGKIFFLIEKYEKAIESLIRYEENRKTDKEAMNLLGECYYVQKKYETGLSYFNRLIKLEPHEGLWYLKRGIYFLQKQDYKDAQSQFLRALELNEELSDSYYYLAKVYEGMGNAEQALDHYYLFQKKNGNETDFPDLIERIESLQQQINR
jgi:tetratricopeptide (TPR) repeat protein